MHPDPSRETEEIGPPTDKDLNFAGRVGDRAGPQSIGAFGFLGFLAAWFATSKLPGLHVPQQILVFLAFTAAPMILVGLFVNRVHRRRDIGLRPKAGPISPSRCGVKLLGLLSTLSIMALAYWVFPEYRRDFYAPVWDSAIIALPAIAPIVLAYFIWIDRRMIQPKDGYWHTGLLVLGRWRAVDWREIREHCLGWVIKGFFLPFMIAGFGQHLVNFLKQGWDPTTFPSLFETSFSLLFSLDTVFGAVGYILTLRLLDAHIRSSQSTWLGWISALICYAPFSQFMNQSFLTYKGAIDWRGLFEGYPIVLLAWGMTILFLEVIYVWSTVSFGYRFSNLTNRGIIVNGPYRLTKHPAYLAKNFAWWMISVPFVAHSTWYDCVRACIALGGLNAVYFIRAKTEERHLLDDPAYAKYCRWIDRYGIVAQLRSIIGIPRRHVLDTTA